MRPRGLAVITAAVVVAVASPGLRASPRDGFPLSNYPMFASDAGRTATVDTAKGVRADGTTVALSPELVTGTSEVILAVSTVSNAVAAGPDRTDRLCAEIASRVAGGRDDVGQIRIATETYDAVAWFDGDTVPSSVVIRATCPVPPR
jgi:hypothetical protein